MMRTAHTFAILEVSPTVYNEIRSKLALAEYRHCFVRGAKDREVIDMTGIAIQANSVLPKREQAESEKE